MSPHVLLLDTPCPLCLGQMREVEQGWGITVVATGRTEAPRTFTCECGHSWTHWEEVERDAQPFIVRSVA